MTRLQRWLLRKIFKELVRQGPHVVNITECLRLLRDAVAVEFTEDNDATLDALLRECLDNTRESPVLPKVEGSSP